MRHLVFFLSSLAYMHADLSIVFVHMGKEAPLCLFPVMKQARFLNPTCDIYLLADDRGYCTLEGEHEVFFEEEKIYLVNMSLISESEEHRTFYEANKIERSIAKGFWLYATERFFLLFDFMRAKGLNNVFHLENDSMLYANLEELLPLFENYQLAAPFQSLVGCIPCFVFIRDSISLGLLIDHILSEMRNYKGTQPHIRVNDMQTLASFYRKFGGAYMTSLPTLMSDYRKYHTKRKSRFLEDNKTDLKFLSMNESLFPGYIFDAAGIGIFLNGNDRKYQPDSGAGTIHSRVLFNPQFFSYSWECDEKGRKIPYLSFKGVKYKIVNLHFHSKMVEDYTSF